MAQEKKCRLNGLKNCIKKNAPEILAVLVCLLALGVGVSQKQGYHMDELLSFELSNARFTPWIVPTQPEGRLETFVRNEIEGDSPGETFQNMLDTLQDVLQNRGSSKMLSYRADVYEEPVWIGAEQFRDYITVDGRDAFNYLSVYFNVKDDNHPPLHFMLLHTVSSLFWGQINPMMGCSINLAAMAGILILLMALGRRLLPGERGRFCGIAAALAYGLSAGAMATVLLIRMYALITFFCAALFYIHVKKWQEEGFTDKNKLLILVTVFGFLSQYFFLFYCLLLAAVTALLLLVYKKYRALLSYVRSMAGAAVIGVALFPFSVSDVFASGRGVEALNSLSEGLRGYGGRIAGFWNIVSGRTFHMLLAPLFLLLFLAVMLQRFGGRIPLSFLHFQPPKQQKPGRGEAGMRKASALVWMYVLPVAGYFLLAARMSPYLVDRYVMPLFPFVVSGLIFGLAAVLQSLEGGIENRAENRTRRQCVGLYTRALCGILVLWQAVGLFRYDGSYQYQGYAVQEQTAAEYADCPCICVYEGVGYYENLMEFTYYDKTLLVKPQELAQRTDKASVEECSRIVLLVKPEADLGQVTEIMEQEYGFRPGKWLFRESVHGDVTIVFENARYSIAKE